MCSSMRLAVFLFVCFAALIAVDSTYRNNSVANEVEKLRTIANVMVRLPSNNSSLNRRLKRDKPNPEWCMQAEDHFHEIIDNCDSYNFSPGYVLRINNANKDTWIHMANNWDGWRQNVEMISTSLTEFNMNLNTLSGNMIISNNPQLESITIKGNPELTVETSFHLEIKGNPKLKTIKIVAKEYTGANLTISDNNELETIEFDGTEYYQKYYDDDEYIYLWTISKNPKLRRIQIYSSKTIWFMQEFHIVENKALTELVFPETLEYLGFSDLIIKNNDNLESIKIPQTTDQFLFSKLEIRRNDKLTSIDLGEQTRWEKVQLIVRENKHISAENLETLKKYGNDESQIQQHGEGPMLYAGSGGGGYSGDYSSSTRGKDIPIALLSSLVILGYQA